MVIKRKLIVALLSLFLLFFSKIASQAITPLKEVIFSEIMVNPKGSDRKGEWIELYNTTNHPINLRGWKIKDMSSKREIINKNLILQPRSFFLIGPPLKKLTINNNGEKLTLFNNQGVIEDEIIIPKQEKEIYSFALNKEGGWEFTTIITPGEENKFLTQEKEPIFSEKDFQKAKLSVGKNPGFKIVTGAALLFSLIVSASFGILLNKLYKD